jgi:CubicO group peptidase (beta-lactamase class C family)
MKKWILITIAGLLLVQSCQTSRDAYFLKQMEKAHVIGLQAASIQGGELVWQGSYGLREYGTDKKVNDSTLFMIASCSKPVTALGVMLLYDRGELNLDDPVDEYLPFHVRNPNTPETPITIRMLLTHTSSLRDDWETLIPLYTLEEGGDSPLELETFVKAYFTEGGEYYKPQTNFDKDPPGSHYDYCNMGYALLGALIEQVSGHTFTDFMKKEIFGPLQMHDSYWFLKEIPHANIARPHEMPAKSRKAAREPEVLKHYGYPDFPDGQLRTTVSDYAQVIKLMINRGKVGESTFIREGTVEEFLRIQYPSVAKYQAVAWNYNEFDNFIYYLLMPRLPSHTGADPGVATVVSFDPENGSGGIIFSNSPTTHFKGRKIFYQEMMKELLKQDRKSAGNG